MGVGSDVPVWTAIGLSSLSLGFGQLAIFVKFSNSVAVNAQRLDEMEKWQKNKSIDRSELEAVEARAKAANDALADRVTTEMHGVEDKLKALSGDVKTAADKIDNVRIDIARIPEQLSRQKEVTELQHEALKHSLANLKMAVQALAPRSAAGTA